MPTRALLALAATCCLTLAACSSDDGEAADDGDPSTTTTADDGATTGDEAGDGDAGDGDGGGGAADEEGDVVVLDGTTYAVTYVACSLDVYGEGDTGVNADLEGGGEAVLSYNPDLEPSFHELEVRVDGETWSLFSGDSHDTLSVSRAGQVVDASGEVGPFAGGQATDEGDLVDASMHVTC